MHEVLANIAQLLLVVTKPSFFESAILIIFLQTTGYIGACTVYKIMRNTVKGLSIFSMIIGSYSYCL